VIRPVELLANENWVITCWHPARVFHGARRLQPDEPGQPPADLFDRIAKRWACGPARNSGDLGVLILHELALSYAPAHRALASWLEDWELGLYVAEKPDLETLPQLWGSMAVLRDWLNPLNRAGLRDDIDRAWLAATDHERVIAVDERVDRALANLAKLATTMRSSFNLLHIQQVREEREHSDRMQHRIEVMAAAFLIPTLIVGFYGANTWLPGEQRHWGFWVMLLVLVVFSVGGALLVHRWHKQQKTEARKLVEDRRHLRSQLMRGPVGEGS